MDVVPLALAVSLLLSSAIGAWFFICNRDLSNRLKKSETAITDTTRLLVQKNIELFDQNLVQQKELAKKDDFLAIASHQLRTPLNEMLWGLSEILENTADAEQKALFERILGSGKRAQKIIEDLLGFVQVNQGQVRRTISPYDPDSVILAIVQRLKGDFKDSGVDVELHLKYNQKITSIDADSFEMIATNLIENAYHYTPSGGHLTVSTKRGADETLEFAVSDTGIGIPPDMMKNMFVKFRRAPDAIARNKEGSGLGLYVIKTLLDLSGGSVTFESEYGKGTTFHIHIPKTGSTSTPAASTGASPVPATPASSAPQKN